jgi:exosortase C (VPDSG-CTERM-specific)
LLVPFISFYLFKVAPPQTERVVLRGSMAGAIAAGLSGLTAFAAYWSLGRTGRVAPNDALALAVFAFLLLLLAAALATLGAQALRAYLFAICFLVFLIPLPTALLEFITIGLQRASADAGEVMLRMTGMPVMRDGMMMQLPGLRIVVAEECSGIRSTLVLFMTSLVASHMFLRTGWKRTALVAAIVPIAIVRNAFRIATIAWLTVNVDSRVIHSPLHHRGGPIFFVLSLIPFFLLLWWLRKSERSKVRP